MKPIKIIISDDTEVHSAINSLNERIPDQTKNSTEFLTLYHQIKDCIEEFSEKAKKLAKEGTTIHIQKEFTFPNVSVFVVLDYPPRVGFFEKLSGILKRE